MGWSSCTRFSVEHFAKNGEQERSKECNMSSGILPVGTVISDQDTPTYEVLRIKLKAGQHLRPGTLVRIPVVRREESTLIGRIRSAYERNPNEGPEDINVRDTLGIAPNYPREEDSTTIYRLVEADLIEEIFEEEGRQQIRAPQTLPNSGASVYIANDDEIVFALGLHRDKSLGLHVGETVSGATTSIILKRESIQRHIFIGGTTGSGKSYAMGVIVEELVRHGLPIVFIDTQDEYSKLATLLEGHVKTPGKDFNIRISSLTEFELLDLLPKATTELQRDIAARAFSELKAELESDGIAKFTIDDLLKRMEDVGPELTNKESSIAMAISRTASLKRNDIFGEGIGRADWRRLMSPCLVINCKGLTSSRLQPVATAVLRELQTLRLHNHIPPYVAVIDEAHLFVPQGESSSCKQIIREGVRIGRHHGICMVLLTQSPVDIDKSAIRQCNTRLIFALEPDQLDAIRGVKADATEEMLRALPKMPQGTCLLSGTYESVKHAIPIKIRKRELEDSEGGETPDIFQEMKEKWHPLIAQLEAK
jgi:DNA helicase HerA-like ATPase